MNKTRGCFIAIVILFFVSLLVVLCITVPNWSGEDQEVSSGGNINVLGSRDLLFLGLDERETSDEFVGRTDTIIIFHLGEWGQKDTLISIPRDTRVNLEGYGWNKINAAYVYGGDQMLKQEIYELTGIEIDRTMLINFEGFKKVIDILGGVEITVEEPLHDPLSGADFEPGTYNMDGEQALSYARCRATAKGDLDRIDRQQQLLNELIRQKFNFSSITKAPQLIEVLNQETKSDFGLGDFVAVGSVLMFSNKEIQRVTIPTTSANIEGISYLIADEAEVKAFLQPYLYPDQE